MRKLLITTGPQGSGNHLFARLMSLHPDVVGWEKLKDNYWVPSDEEPFARYWVHPEELEFPKGDFFCANVSVPFFYDGVRQVPKIRQVCEKALSLGVKPVVAIICRDKNINAVQQKRVGGEVTLPTALSYYKSLIDSDIDYHFIDHEAFFLYKDYYVWYLGRILKFPVNTKEVNKFITDDPNCKYVSSVDDYWLDSVIREGRKPFTLRQEV